MKKVNTTDLEELTWRSPKGTFATAGKQVSEALGRKPRSTSTVKSSESDPAPGSS